MKKIIILIIYLIFITLLNTNFWNLEISLIDYCNLIFLNVKSYYNYGLSIWHIQYIVSFLVFIIILIVYNLPYINENYSFLNMIIYREGRKNTINRVLKSNVLDLSKYYLVINITVVCICFIMPHITIEEKFLYSWSIFSIYLIRIMVLLFFIIMKNFVDSLKNDFSISMIKIIISILLLIFFDIIIQSNFICFSKNILYELGYLTTYAIIVAIYYYFKVIRGGKE